MHPFNHVFIHRGPSRIFWFLFGAGAATWWHYAKMHDHRAQYFPCVMHRRRVEGQADPSQASRPSADNGPQETTWRPAWGPDRDGTFGWNQREWEQDKERLKHFQKRAEDTVVDLSESTLESIVTAAEALKTKLAELRLERERLEREKKDGPVAA